MKRKFLKVLITMAMTLTMATGLITPVVYAEEGITKDEKIIKVENNKMNDKSDKEDINESKEEINKVEEEKEVNGENYEENKVKEEIKDESTKKPVIEENKELENNTKEEMDKENANNEAISEKEENKIPVELWENNSKLIAEVCDKSGKDNIQDVTYSDIKEIRMIDMVANNEKIPDIIGDFEKLVVLDLNMNYDVKLPNSISKLKNLKELTLRNMNLDELPKWLQELNKLEYLDIANNKFNQVPDVVWKLKNLKDLNLLGCNISTISSKIRNVNKLESLELGYNSISILPEELYTINSLRYLGLSNNKMQEIPSGIFKISKLENLILSENNIISIPNEVINMKGDKCDFYLDVSLNQVCNLPQVNNQVIVCDSNFIPSVKGGVPTGNELRFKKKEINMEQGKVVNQEELRSLIEGFARINYEETRIFNIDPRHNIQIVIDGKVVSMEELSKMKEGNYKAQFKLENADMGNKNAITKEFININIGNVGNIEDDDKTAIDPEIPENATGKIPYEYWQNCAPLMMFTLQYLQESDINEVTYEDIAEIDYLIMNNQELDDLPKIVEKFIGLKEVYINGNDFNNVPEEILKLKDLRIVSLSYNNIKELGNELEELTSLEYINFDNNDIRKISCDLSKLNKLETISFTGNKNINSQVDKIYKAQSVKRLFLDSCNLYTIGDEESFMRMNNLEYLEVYDNQLVNSIDKNLCLIQMHNNFIKDDDRDNKQLMLKENTLSIEKKRGTSQEELRTLVNVKGVLWNGEEMLEDLNENHNLTFIINNKEYTANEVAKLKVGQYKAKFKIQAADISNLAAITEDEINLTVTGEDDVDSIDPMKPIVPDNNNQNISGNSNIYIGNNQNSSLPKTGGFSAAAVTVLGLGAIIGGVGSIKRKKDE